MSQISIVAYSVTLTEMHYLFFLIVGHPDVDICRVLCSRAIINITMTQLHKPMASLFDDHLIIGYGKTMIGFKHFEFHNPSFKVFNGTNSF